MNLILIFNGWGMDDSILTSLIIPQNYHIKVVNFPYTLDKLELKKYDKIIYIGWSFGCYYLSKFIIDNNIHSAITVAINGHGNTIGKFGIMPKMFDFTLNTLTPDSLIKFYENMDISSNFNSPKKEFEDIKNELQHFKDNFSPLDNIFKYAFIGKKDKIIPTARQIKYFTTNNIDITTYEFGHYPFDEPNLLIDVVERVTNEF